MTRQGYRIDVRRIDDFPARELYALLKMRVDVFIVEQDCVFADLDGKDLDAWHLRLLDGDELLGAARIFAPAGAGEPESGAALAHPR